MGVGAGVAVGAGVGVVVAVGSGVGVIVRVGVAVGSGVGVGVAVGAGVGDGVGGPPHIVSATEVGACPNSVEQHEYVSQVVVGSGSDSPFA